MHKIWGGVFRTRRPASVEDRLRPSRSRSTLNDRPSASQRQPILGLREYTYIFFDAASFFLAKGLNELLGRGAFLIVPTISFTISAFLSFIVARPSATTFRLVLNQRRARAFLFLALLHLLRICLLFAAVGYLGAGRSLIATGSAFSITGIFFVPPLRFSLSSSIFSPSPLLGLAGLTLVSYDASDQSFLYNKTARIPTNLLSRDARRVVRKKLYEFKGRFAQLPFRRDSAVQNVDSPNLAELPDSDSSGLGDRESTDTERARKRGQDPRELKSEEKVIPKPLAPERNEDIGEVSERSASRLSVKRRRILAVVNEKRSSDENEADQNVSDDAAQDNVDARPDDGRTSFGGNRTDNEGTVNSTSKERANVESKITNPENETNVAEGKISSKIISENISSDSCFRDMFLWGSVIVLTRLLMTGAEGVYLAAVSDVGDWSIVMTCVSLFGLCVQIPVILMSVFGWAPAEWSSWDITQSPEAFLVVVLFGICSFWIPALLLHPNMSSTVTLAVRAPFSGGVAPHGLFNISSFLRLGKRKLGRASERCFIVYIMLLFYLPFLQWICTWAVGLSDHLSSSSYYGALILILATFFEARRSRKVTAQRISGVRVDDGSQDVSSVRAEYHGRIGKFSQIQVKCQTAFRTVQMFIAQTHANKASWQVLSFLLLQGAMVLVEAMYASINGKAGLILISADNLFCCMALGIGLLAIRQISVKPSPVYTYGLTRFESLCGFTNGLLLMYVGVLVVLEAIERQLNSGEMEYVHTYAVCIFGVVGNLTGLVFFPPESRRENHNVQGIYLHIWGNTLAFVGVGLSAALTQVAPEGLWIGAAVAAAVALIISLSAAPLVIRSSRVLLLKPAFEKLPEVKMLRERLERFDSVSAVSALRVWNLTPTRMVASVRISCYNLSEVEESELLAKVRALFASIGVPAAHATIQISNYQQIDAVSPRIHKRALSGVPDPTPELEGLYIEGQRGGVV